LAKKIEINRWIVNPHVLKSGYFYEVGKQLNISKQLARGPWRAGMSK
jgi:hypothetical protein